jgi:RNA polymerase sigma-70 factor (ECF subfamily)
VLSKEESDLISRLRARDEIAFTELVEKYHPSMIRVASAFTPTRSVAEDAVQDAWIGVIRGIDRFEGRSSLKTWIFRILVNRAKTAGMREPRTVELGREDDLGGDRFGANGMWADPPVQWADDVDDRLAAPEVAALVRAAIEELPDLQRQVVTLRDVEGLSSADVREMLDLSEGNQRVLLHRGRTRVRAALEKAVREEG